jgi:hypothetical protein
VKEDTSAIRSDAAAIRINTEEILARVSGLLQTTGGLRTPIPHSKVEQWIEDMAELSSYAESTYQGTVFTPTEVEEDVGTPTEIEDYVGPVASLSKPKIYGDKLATSSPRRHSHHSSRHRSHRDSRNGSKEGSRHFLFSLSNNETIVGSATDIQPRTTTKTDAGRSDSKEIPRVRKHRTPEEQEAHDRRKEERRRLRELEKAKKETGTS